MFSASIIPYSPEGMLVFKMVSSMEQRHECDAGQKGMCNLALMIVDQQKSIPIVQWVEIQTVMLLSMLTIRSKTPSNHLIGIHYDPVSTIMSVIHQALCKSQVRQQCSKRRIPGSCHNMAQYLHTVPDAPKCTTFCCFISIALDNSG